MTDEHHCRSKEPQYLEIGHGGFHYERLSKSGSSGYGEQEINIAESGFSGNIEFPEIYPSRRFENAQMAFVNLVPTKSA
jgi:hypothetical protein